MTGVYPKSDATRKWVRNRKVQFFEDWDDLYQAAQAGQVDVVAVESVGLVARTAGQLDDVLRKLDDLGVAFVGIAEGFKGDDKVTRAVVAALAGAEVAKRQAGTLAGIEEKRKRVEAGEDTWNFGPKTASKLTPEVKAKIYAMKDSNTPVAEIARVLELSRPTVYAALKERKTQDG